LEKRERNKKSNNARSHSEVGTSTNQVKGDTASFVVSGRATSKVSEGKRKWSGGHLVGRKLKVSLVGRNRGTRTIYEEQEIRGIGEAGSWSVRV